MTLTLPLGRVAFSVELKVRSIRSKQRSHRLTKARSLHSSDEISQQAELDATMAVDRAKATSELFMNVIR